MKIAVYTIARNEEEFVERWVNSTDDADIRLVLDTGSTDKTVGKLEAHGVAVIERRIEPWRFDVARNIALDNVPSDTTLCISLDLDEVLTPGWRTAIERVWREDTTRIIYPDVRGWHDDGRAQRVINGFKVHARHAYRWRYAIHEILIPVEPEVNDTAVHCEDFAVHHRPNHAKSREIYYEILMNMSDAEPDEPHYQYYLGQALITRGALTRAIEQFGLFLNQFPNEDRYRRSNAFRLRAWCRKQLGQSSQVIFEDLLLAAKETPEQRECWGNLAAYSGECHLWTDALRFTTRALECQDRSKSLFIDPQYWNGQIERMQWEASRHVSFTTRCNEPNQ